MSLCAWGARIAISAEVFIDLEFTGYFEGYALSEESSPSLKGVAINNMHEVSEDDPDPTVAFVARALMREANCPKNLASLEHAWNDWMREKHGEGAKADHLWNARPD